MASIYRVRDGDCISSIAFKHGFYWKTLWDLNAQLRQSRWDPNILLPGDQVEIPDLRIKQESGSTEARHRFRKCGTPAKLRLVIEDNGQPRANEPYVLVIDGVTHQGQTSDSGLLEHPMPPDARRASLEMDGLSCSFTLGTMNPIPDNTGVQLRLQNLGFYDGAIDGVIGPLTEEAIAAFQAFYGVEGTGELDEQRTRDKLLERQDREHEAPQTQRDDSSDEGPSSDGDGEDDEDLSDGEAPDEDEDFPETELEVVDDESDGEGGTWQ